MHLLRNHPRFLGLVGRWVLLWFALSIGAAVASPIVHPQAVELVCSSAGSIKAVVHTEDGVQEMGASHMDCPLCVLTGAPPPSPAAAAFDSPMPWVRALPPVPASRVVSSTPAPLPARGPPALS